MIRYALRCGSAHTFDSWFRDSSSFDEQKADGHVLCPICGSQDVDKMLMAPSVRTSRRKDVQVAEAAPPHGQEIAAAEPVMLADEHAAKLRAMMRDFRDHLVRNSHDVGPNFPEEARKIHDGVAEQRAIRGEASPDEVRALLEDGIEVMPFPILPSDRN